MRWIAFLLLPALLHTAAACGGDEADERSGEEPTATVEAGAADTAEPLEATDTPPPPEPSDTPPPPPEPTDTPEPEIERIVTAVPGAVAEADDVRITLNEITDPWVSGNQLIQPAPGRRFVAFDVTIQNTAGRGTHGANPRRFRLSDAEDFAYEGSLSGPEPSLSSTDLGSGQKTRGWIAFEVAEGTPLQMLKYDPRLFSTNDIEFHFR